MILAICSPYNSQERVVILVFFLVFELINRSQIEIFCISVVDQAALSKDRTLYILEHRLLHDGMREILDIVLEILKRKVANLVLVAFFFI